jgi:uncharacterized protein YcaQ
MTTTVTPRPAIQAGGDPLTLTPTLARRLAIRRQRLAGPPAPATAAGLLDVVRDLGCLQLDPTNAVARTHLLVLWSRVGVYDPAALDTLLWEERALFEYWAHAASLVLTEHFPVHAYMMRRYGKSGSPWSERITGWIETNAALRDHILDELRAHGPLPARTFEDRSVERWQSSGWTGGRNVGRMLDFLWTRGEVLVAGRVGSQRLWDLAEHVLPAWTPQEEWPEAEVVRFAAQKALRALGVARPAEIELHYTRDRYPGLAAALADLEAERVIVPAQIVDAGRAWPGPYYVHRDDLPLLDRLAAGAWEPRTTLLSPFDNLICDRARTERLFDFRFRIEIYVPKDKREYGYYVLPILHGDRLIGRIDPLMDRKHHRLTINAVYAEPDAPMDDETAQAIAAAIQRLATFLGATDIAYPATVPAGWGSALR